eukprot:7324646-Prymnesium_polylepis.1
MDATPADLKKWQTNIYSQIAIALKGGELREPGLATLAGRLAQRIDRTAFVPDWLSNAESGKRRHRIRFPTIFKRIPQLSHQFSDISSVAQRPDNAEAQSQRSTRRTQSSPRQTQAAQLVNAESSV